MKRGMLWVALVLLGTENDSHEFRALVFQSSGELYRGTTGQLEVTWESFGATPITVKRTVLLQ